MEDEAVKKCPNCGETLTENAHFCASCGYSLANFCPNCGTIHNKDARFCAKCGHAFVKEVKATTNMSPVKKIPKGIIGRVVRLIPAGLFGLFAVLTFLFYLSPMVKMPLLGGMGNVYEFMAGQDLIKEKRLQDLAVVYFVFAMLALGVGVLYAVAVTPYGKRFRYGKEVFLYDILSWLTIGVYLFFFVFSIIFLVELKGMEKVASSSVSVLMIVFSIIFTLLTVTCNVLGYTRFGARWEKPTAIRQIVAPTTPVIAEIKEEGEAKEIIDKYLKSSRNTAKFVCWMPFILYVLLYCLLIIVIIDFVCRCANLYNMDPAFVDGMWLTATGIAICISVITNIPIMKKINKETDIKKERIYAITTSKKVKGWTIGVGIMGGVFSVVAICISVALLTNRIDLEVLLVIIGMIIQEILLLCAFFAMLSLNKKRKETLNHPAVKLLWDLCMKNIEGKKEYLKATKRYKKEEKRYQKLQSLYIYDMEKYEKYLAYMNKA